jgi:hypothetical protein
MAPRDPPEIGPPGAVQSHRNDGGAGLDGGEGRAVVDLHETTGGRDPAFWEDQDGPSRFEQPHHLSHRQRLVGSKVRKSTRRSPRRNQRFSAT